MICRQKLLEGPALSPDGGGTSVTGVEFGIIWPGKDGPAQRIKTLGQGLG